MSFLASSSLWYTFDLSHKWSQSIKLLEEMKVLAGWMEDVAKICQKAEGGLDKYENDLEIIHAEVRGLATEFPVPSL